MQELDQHWFSYWLACKAFKVKDLSGFFCFSLDLCDNFWRIHVSLVGEGCLTWSMIILLLCSILLRCYVLYVSSYLIEDLGCFDLSLSLSLSLALFSNFKIVRVWKVFILHMKSSMFCEHRYSSLLLLTCINVRNVFLLWLSVNRVMNLHGIGVKMLSMLGPTSIFKVPYAGFVVRSWYSVASNWLVQAGTTLITTYLCYLFQLLCCINALMLT